MTPGRVHAFGSCLLGQRVECVGRDLPDGRETGLEADEAGLHGSRVQLGLFCGRQRLQVLAEQVCDRRVEGAAKVVGALGKACEPEDAGVRDIARGVDEGLESDRIAWARLRGRSPDGENPGSVELPALCKIGCATRWERDGDGQQEQRQRRAGHRCYP